MFWMGLKIVITLLVYPFAVVGHWLRRREDDDLDGEDEWPGDIVEKPSPKPEKPNEK